MAKLTLTDPTAGYNSSSVVAANNALVEAAIENTISRDGTAPNTMEAALDLNSNLINNLSDGVSNQDAVTVAQLNAATLGSAVVTASVINAGASTDGQVLTSDGASGAAWETIVAGVISAEASTDGFVLTSDGAGNAAWETPSVAASYVAGDMDAEASTDGWVLTSDGAGNAAWEATGAGDITKVGTPANNQVAVWTGDGTLEGESSVTWDETDFTVAGGITGTTIGGITEANLVDKSATETISGTWTWTDSTKLQLGTGVDMQLYHNGTNSYLDLTGASNIFYLRTNATENAITVAPNGGVTIAYDGTTVLTTTATGTTIAGILVPEADGTRDLATTSTRFATAYVDDLDVTSDITAGASVFLNEQAAAKADVAGYGQLWIKNTTPNELWFTDDAGTDAQVAPVGDSWGDVVDAVITPDADGTRDFGLTGTRFATAYVDDLDVTTNIVVGGTVDGRDLAADGTKLDAIEGAADVTDTANVTSAGALMDSEVDANIKTLILPGSTTISTFGKTLVDDVDAAAARTTLAIDAIAPAHGEMTISGNATATTVSVSDTYYQVVAGWATGNVEDITFSTNELVVGTTGIYYVSCSFSFTGATNDTFTFAIGDNDAAVASTAIQRKTSTTDVGAVSVQGVLSLTAADAVQLYGKNNADTDNFTVTDANFSIFRIG